MSKGEKQLLLLALAGAGIYYLLRNQKFFQGHTDAAVKFAAPQLITLDPNSIKAPAYVSSPAPDRPLQNMEYYSGSDGLIR